MSVNYIFSGLLVLSFLLLVLMYIKLSHKKKLIKLLENKLKEITHLNESNKEEHLKKEAEIKKKLNTINEGVQSIESRCALLIKKNDILELQLKKSENNLESLQKGMQDVTSTDVSVFISWLKENNINLENAKIMIEQAFELTNEIFYIKEAFSKLENEKRLLENYTNALSTQLQILLDANK